MKQSQRTLSQGVLLSQCNRQCSAAGTPSLLHTVTAPVTGPASARSRVVVSMGSAPTAAPFAGGRVPWGAEVEYAYRAGYDSRGRVSVTHLVDERGYSIMLTQPERDGA